VCVRRPEREVGNSLPTNVQLKNERGFISTSLVRLHGVDRNFTFFNRKFIKLVFVEPEVCTFYSQLHATANIKICAGYACNETGCDGPATAANPS
jgi:hypothetical protein